MTVNLKRVNFEAAEIPPHTDLNAMGSFSMEGIGDLVEAITTKQDVFFNDVVPLAAETGTDVQITCPDIYFAANKALAYVAASVNTVTPPGGDTQIGVYLKVSKNPSTGSRDKLIFSGGTYVRSTFATVVVKEDWIGTLIFTFSASSSIAPPAPVLAPGVDIGALLWATITVAPHSTPPPNYDIGVVQNIAALWRFPGSTIALIGHALTHMPGGGDTIAPAVLNPLNSKGSDPGLVPDGDRWICDQAIMRMAVAASAGFLQVTVSPLGNTADPTGAPRTASIAAQLEASLHIAANKLGVVFGGTGSSGLVSRSDHTHVDLTTLPFGDGGTYLFSTLGSADLGTRINVIISGLPTMYVYGFKMFWTPPGYSEPRVECGHYIFINPSTAIPLSVGIKLAKEIAPGVVRLIIGDKALTFLDQGTLAYVKTFTGGTIPWTYDTVPNFPTSGKIWFEYLKRT